MSAKAKVIPYRYYYDASNGRSFSLFTSWRTPGAVLVEKGFTIAWPDGTYGCARGAFASVAEAEAYLAKVPKGFTGMNMMSN